MPKALSQDLRLRIVNHYHQHGSCRGTARHFSVSKSVVQRLSALHKTQGSLSPKQMGGYKKVVLDPYRDQIVDWVENEPDITAEALREKLVSQDYPSVANITVSRFLKRLGYTYKKDFGGWRAGTTRCQKTST